MTHEHLQRLLEALFPGERARLPLALNLIWRLVGGEAIGPLVAEAVRGVAPPSPADASPLPETLRTGPQRP